jgi:hypothetical protein
MLVAATSPPPGREEVSMARRSTASGLRPWLTVLLVSLGATAHAGLTPQFTIHRSSISWFFMDYDNGDGVPNRTVAYGLPDDVGLLADMDGDTLSDMIVYRGGNWFIDLRNDGAADVVTYLGGLAGDIPVVGQFNGNGKAGIGVYRPSDGNWYLDKNVDGALDHISFFGGAAGDKPVVADYNGDGVDDRAVFNAGVWKVDYGFNGTTDATFYLGLASDIPMAGDFDGDWKADNVVYRAGAWLIDYANNSTVDRVVGYGGPDDRPLFGQVNPAASRFVRVGAAGGNGTQALPYGTIAAALPGAPPGTTIRIAAGAYPEAVTLFNQHGLTFLGAGVKATHLQGSGDAFVVIDCQNTVLRNVHVKSPNGRGVINLGSNLTLDRITTKKNWSHGVLGVQSASNQAVLVVDSSNINKSRMGNGLRLEGGVNATVRRSTIDANGAAVVEPAPTASGVGRGVEAFNNSQLTLEYSSVSRNYDGGLAFVQTATAVVRYSTIQNNGVNGFFFQQNAAGDLHNNNILNNGTAGVRGPAGFNGIEVFNGWTGPSMQIHENWINGNAGNGIYLGGSAAAVLVANNYFFNNFVGMTVNAEPANVTLQGNTFELPLAQANEEGMLIVGPGPTVTVGGPGVQNTFKNYLAAGGASPGIHCAGTPAPTVTCPVGGNIWDNVDLKVIGCPVSCSSAP